MFTKSKTNVSFAITVKIVHIFLSNLSGSCSNQC